MARINDDVTGPRGTPVDQTQFETDQTVQKTTSNRVFLKPKARYEDSERSSGIESDGQVSTKLTLVPPDVKTESAILENERARYAAAARESLAATQTAAASTTTPTFQTESLVFNEAELKAINNNYRVNVQAHLKADASLTPEEARIAAFFFYNPDASFDPTKNPGVDINKIRSALKSAQQKALDSARAFSSLPDWNPDQMKDEFSQAYQLAFLYVTRDNPENAEKYEFALYHPELADPVVSAELREKINEYMSKDQGVMAPNGWAPNNADYDKELSKEFDSFFEKALDEHRGSLQFSDDHVARIRLMYYTGNRTPYRGISWNEVQKMIDYAKADFEAEFHVPPTWKGTPDKAHFEDFILADYRIGNEEAYREAVLTMDPENRKYLMRALYGDKSPAIPYEVAKIADKIKADGIEKMRMKYGFDITWQPVGPALMTADPMAFDALDTLKDMREAAQKYVKTLSDGEVKMVFLNYLKEISLQIQQYELQLHEMEIASSKEIRTSNTAFLEMQNVKREKINKAREEQKAEQDKADAKQRTQAKLGLAMKILTPIMAVISVVAIVLSAGTLGPACVAVMIAMTTLTVADQIGKEFNVNIMDTFMAGLGKCIESAMKAGGCGEVGSKWGSVIGKFLVIAAIVAACILSGNVSGTTMITGTGIAVLSTSLVAQSNVSQDIVMGCGCPAKEAAYTGMAINIVLTIGSTSIAANAGLYRTGNVAARLTNRINTITQEMANTTSVLTKIQLQAELIATTIVRNIIKDPVYMTKRIQDTMQLGIGSVQMSNGILEKAIDDIHAEMAHIKARGETSEVTMQDLIDAIRQAIKKLQQLLDEFMAMGTSLSESQRDKYKVIESINF